MSSSTAIRTALTLSARPRLPFLDAQAPLVLGKRDPIVGRKRPLPSLGPDCHLLAQFASLTQPVTGELVKLLHLVTSVAEDHAR